MSHMTHILLPLATALRTHYDTNIKQIDDKEIHILSRYDSAFFICFYFQNRRLKFCINLSILYKYHTHFVIKIFLLALCMLYTGISHSERRYLKQILREAEKQQDFFCTCILFFSLLIQNSQISRIHIFFETKCPCYTC